MKLPIYLDSHATTPCDPRVIEKMLPFFSQHFGNASNVNHAFGKKAQEACEKAREQVASLIKASPREIIFTSGATESNNQALIGIARAYKDKGTHIITTQIEHKSVMNPLKFLENEGFKVTWLSVDRHGLVDVEEIRKNITTQTILISVMTANNEIGTIEPILEIGKLASAREVLFFTDAVQAVGKLSIDVDQMNIDLLSIAGHKMYGPKGIGALYIRSKGPKVRILPIIYGSNQERSLRSGTLNVPGIVGLGEACAIAQIEMREESLKGKKLRDQLERNLLSKLPNVYVNGHPKERLDHNLNVSFLGIESDQLVLEMPNLAVSTGTACKATSKEPSHVLKALGLNDEMALSSIRFGIGRFNTEEELDYASCEVERAVNLLREKSALWKQRS